MIPLYVQLQLIAVLGTVFRVAANLIVFHPKLMVPIMTVVNAPTMKNAPHSIAQQVSVNHLASITILMNYIQMGAIAQIMMNASLTVAYPMSADLHAIPH